MKGTIAVNTTRDYLKSAVFFASSAITLTTFTVGYAGEEKKNEAKPSKASLSCYTEKQLSMPMIAPVF